MESTTKRLLTSLIDRVRGPRTGRSVTRLEGLGGTVERARAAAMGLRLFDHRQLSALVGSNSRAAIRLLTLRHLTPAAARRLRAVRVDERVASHGGDSREYFRTYPNR